MCVWLILIKFTVLICFMWTVIIGKYVVIIPLLKHFEIDFFFNDCSKLSNIFVAISTYVISFLSCLLYPIAGVLMRTHGFLLIGYVSMLSELLCASYCLLIVVIVCVCSFVFGHCVVS